MTHVIAFDTTLSTMDMFDKICCSNDLDEKDFYFNTVLHTCVWTCKREFFGLLIHAGAAIGEKNSVGSTALHIAAYIDDLKSIKILLGLGATKDAVNDSGQTPFDLAAYWGDTQCTALLKHA